MSRTADEFLKLYLYLFFPFSIALLLVILLPFQMLLIRLIVVGGVGNTEKERSAQRHEASNSTPWSGAW